MTTVRASLVGKKKRPQESTHPLKSSKMRVTRSRAGQNAEEGEELLISEVIPELTSSGRRSEEEDTVMFEASEKNVGSTLKSNQQHQKHSSQNESSVSTTTTQNDQAHTIIECSLLHCDESPMAAHYGELDHSINNKAAAAAAVEGEVGNTHQRDPQHRHSRRVVAPLIQKHLVSSSDPPKSLKRSLGASKGGGGLAKQSRLEELAEQFKFMSRKDEETRPDPCYLGRHGPKMLPNEYINGNMRTICCGWMVELSLEFKFQQETLMLAIRIFDRYLSLSHQPVSRKVLQLVAISSMLVASKMEEVVHPSVKDFSRMSADTFSISDVKRMEVVLLQTLEYRIHSPSIGSYVNIIQEATDISPAAYYMACYLTELSSLHYPFLQFSPSLVASSAVYVAGLISVRNSNQKEGAEEAGEGKKCITNKKDCQSSSPLLAWTDKLNFLTGYSCSDLKKCAAAVTKVHAEACKDLTPDSPLMPLKDKYRVFSNLCVSNEKPIELKH
jgi:hypothetical protein